MNKTSAQITLHALLALSGTLACTFLFAAMAKAMFSTCVPADDDTCYLEGVCGSYAPGEEFFCCFTDGSNCCACKCQQVLCAQVDPEQQELCPATGILTFNCSTEVNEQCRQGPTYQYCGT